MRGDFDEDELDDEYFPLDDQECDMKFDRRFNYNYNYNPNYFGSKTHTYELVGHDGAIHFHVTESNTGEYYGGLEEHRRVCPDGEDKPPSHINCRLLGGPCWHDGTSLYASEVLIPRWREEFPNHDETFAWLVNEFDKRFRAKTDEALVG